MVNAMPTPIKVEDIISDVNMFLYRKGIPTGKLTNTEKINSIKEAQNILASEGYAFDDKIYISLEENVASYALPDNFISIVGHPIYNDSTILRPKPSNSITSSTIQYFEISNRTITIYGTPTEDDDDAILIPCFRRAVPDITQLSDEVEFCNRYPEYSSAIRNYVLYDLFANNSNVADEPVSRGYRVLFINVLRKLSALQLARFTPSSIYRGQ